MDSDNLFANRYFLERLIGRGNFSEVWLAKDTLTDIKVALKIYAPATGLDDAGLNVFAREFALVVNANHKNLLKPIFYDAYDRKPYLVLPFCGNGSIMKNVGKFSEADAWRLLRDVASGLAWLHGMNPPIIHQDIKPDNIMIGDNGDFMITDFGVSTHVKSTLRKSLSSAFSSAGTIAYMAPERFSKDNTPIMANDIYSLGATAYEMLTGDTPFGDDGGLMQKKGAEIPDLQGDFSPTLKKVLRKCLETEPWHRPTAEQLEKYATAAIAGQHVRFDDEKTPWQKFKWPIIAGGVIVAAGIVGAIFAISSSNAAKQQQLAEERIQAANDSIQAVVTRYVASADSLRTIGDAHDEGYEAAYLEAYDLCRKALGSNGEIVGNADAKAKTEADIKPLTDDLEQKLYDAYTSFVQKAGLFADDPEVADEFNQRAAKISDAIDVAKFQTASPAQ